MHEFKNILLGALLVGVVVLGYLYYESQQPRLEINIPPVKIEKN